MEKQKRQWLKALLLLIVNGGLCYLKWMMIRLSFIMTSARLFGTVHDNPELNNKAA